MNTVLDPLLMPDQVQLSDADRQAAAAKLDHAVRQGTLTPPQAAGRRDLLDTARTRGELRQVFDGVYGALPPDGLTVGMRAATAIWLVTCVVQFVVWLTMAAFGNLDWPWWLFSSVGLGLAVGILWWTHESYHRKTAVQVEQ
ncbi:MULTISPECIES: DUF1707 SHOCT-like domain-containing protein [unclassified Kribbella]|uniref:DUF1707 SHOCT-like domain-containing protein n=1 Tax=unclassified Kribbella TaxID=2644121 RepID=UPI00301942E1